MLDHRLPKCFCRTGTACLVNYPMLMRKTRSARSFETVFLVIPKTPWFSKRCAPAIPTRLLARWIVFMLLQHMRENLGSALYPWWLSDIVHWSMSIRLSCIKMLDGWMHNENQKKNQIKKFLKKKLLQDMFVKPIEDDNSTPPLPFKGIQSN